ncbi:MAG TPA: sigma 54-interacting transcriptional regulator [Bacillota bacterium]|nr:sigma 54-interacting transcriptional regulator [Bacillota bacterium]
MKKDQPKFKKLQNFAITEAIGDAMYIVSADGPIIAANQACENILGLKNEELIGMTIDDMWTYGIFETEHNFFLGYDDRSVNDLLRQLNEMDFETTIVRDAPRLSDLARKKGKTVCGITRLAISKKVALFVSIPVFDSKGELDSIHTIVRDLTEIIEIKNKIQEVESRLDYFEKRQFDQFIGESPAMRNIKYLISQTAASDATVLITGETGTGKEVVAKELLKKSNRSDKPCICINCAAIPETLFESEVFGYEKGAFTGALNKRKLGLLEMANGGTVLFDEVEELPMPMQSKLLRAIQEKEIRRIGGTESVKIDIRIISCTNRSLKEMINEGTFREDLFYRLNVISIKIPPLRDRNEDIIPMANAFLKKFNDKYKKNKVLEPLAATRLEYHDWPGNVRELEHAIERLVVIGEHSIITEEEVNFALNDERKFEKIRIVNLQEAVGETEKRVIENAFKVYKSSRKVANVLGVSQPTILRKAKKLGIVVNEE